MSKALTYYILISFSVIIVPFLVNAQYIPILAYLYVSPFLMLFNLNKIEKRDVLLLLMSLSIAATFVTHVQTSRYSTVLFSIMNIIGFLFFTKIIVKARISVYEFIRLVKCIIYAYLIVLIIQQISTLLNLPVLNGFGYKGFKLNSLTMEPSHTGIVMTVLLFSWIKLKEIIDGRKISLKNLRWSTYKSFYAAAYVLLTCGSVTCIFGFLVILLYFLNKRQLLAGIIFLTLLSVVFFLSNFEVALRIKTLIPAILTLNYKMIYEVDPSSSARIAPYLIYISDFNVFDINTWIGHGCDYSKDYLVDALTGQSDGENHGVGGFICFMIDYGLIPTILFVTYLKYTVGFKSFAFFIFFVMVSSSPFNTYFFWVYMYFVYFVYYYIRYSRNEICIRKRLV